MRRIEKNNKIMENLKKVVKVLKVVLFITMLILTYFISEKAIDYLFTLDKELVKRALNIILVAIVVTIKFYKKED